MNTARRNAPFLVLAALAAVFAGIVWFAMPHDREVKSLGILLFKLVPFVLATEAIAQLDPVWAQRIRLHLVVPVCFLVYFCYFVPKIFFVAENHPELYYYILTLTPFVILSLVLAFRIGGGAAHLVRRLSYAMILLMLSGLEDLAFLTVNDHTDPAWQTIPEVWTWASHITVFLGHPASKYEAYAFIAVHVLLALFLLFAPTRWFAPLARAVRRTPVQAPNAG
ncbi:hypothetical protein ACFTZ8_11255 [Streptomyces fungicidicus]|uniref:hypothetical protein n=1 Tax=Streptomyces TaxID=1883 RepID=UPI001591955F|nr:hypothetical protein [Streptomyces sp. NA02536]QKW01586.1 hypothetical protein HUT14_17855 [Streptomyces sp. NA02536]